MYPKTVLLTPSTIQLRKIGLVRYLEMYQIIAISVKHEGIFVGFQNIKGYLPRVNTFGYLEVTVS